MYMYIFIHIYYSKSITTSSSSLSATMMTWIGWETKGVLHMKDPPSKIKMGPQRAVAGVGTPKFGVGTGKTIHAIRSSSLA